MLGYELDFNSCAIRDGFCKSSHICITGFCMENISTYNDPHDTTETRKVVAYYKRFLSTWYLNYSVYYFN